MKIAFSIRGINSYPYRWPGPAPVEARRRFFSFARDLGAEGVEVEDTWLPFAEMSDAELSRVPRGSCQFRAIGCRAQTRAATISACRMSATGISSVPCALSRSRQL